MLENFTERDFSVITLNFNEITITTLNYKKIYTTYQIEQTCMQSLFTHKIERIYTIIHWIRWF